MQVEVFTDPGTFATRAAPVLARAPEACNVVATQVARAARAARADVAGIRGDDVYLLVTDGEAPVGVAMHTPPFNLFVGPLQGDSAARALVDALAGRAVPGVTGHGPTAHAVARAWAASTGREWTLRMDETLYRLDAVPAMPGVAGSVRESTPADRGWLNRWLAEFHLEAVPYEQFPPRSESASQTSLQRRGDRVMLVWCADPDEVPVSLAGVTAPRSGVSRIGPVYTPSAFRRHGYAGALTAAGAARAFADGARRVMLYADKANPTSNGVYRRLGFRPFDEAVMITFA